MNNYGIKNTLIFTITLTLLFVFCFFISDSKAGGPTLTIKKLTDPTTMGTTFDFTYNIDAGGDNPFSLEHEQEEDINIPTDAETTVQITETNPDDFIVKSIMCFDTTVIPSSKIEIDPPVINNDIDPSLMADITIMGTNILCEVTNTDDFFTLSVDADNGSAMGTVTADKGIIMCSTDATANPADCSEPYMNGEVVTLSAVPDMGAAFDGYTGTGCMGMNTDIMVTVDQDITCTATFVDADDCDPDPCLNGGVCSDTGPDAFDCDCSGTGYEGDMCETDIDECTEGTDNCDVNATCTNTPGSFTCECNAGYEGDGTMCTDIDACVNNPCDANATCTDLAPPALDDTDGRTCECNEGFMGDGEPGNCDDIDECMAGTDNCDENATCTNTEGSFTCECNEGFEGDGTDGNCDAINECIEMTDNCEQICIDTPEGFNCGCNNGFLLQPDGFSCEPADVNVDIGNEETDEDGLRVLIQLGGDIFGTGMILVDLPSQVVADCADIGSFGNCSLVEPGDSANVTFEDADVICDVDNFPSGGAIELELCLCGEQDEGTVDAEIEVIADNAPGAQFDELVQIFLEELDGCGGGDGCGTVVGTADKEAVAGNVFVSLLPLAVGFAGLFWRRRNRD